MSSHREFSVECQIPEYIIKIMRQISERSRLVYPAYTHIPPAKLDCIDKKNLFDASHLWIALTYPPAHLTRRSKKKLMPGPWIVNTSRQIYWGHSLGWLSSAARSCSLYAWFFYFWRIRNDSTITATYKMHSNRFDIEIDRMNGE